MTQVALQLPLFKPSSTWRPPQEFPDLRQAKELAFDLETCDPGLKQRGPGSIRREGYIVGVAVACSFWHGYFPIRHLGGGNLSSKAVFSWLKEQLSTSCPKVGANLLYDLEWLRTEGVTVSGPLYDVQVAEPLLDEESLTGYSLEALSRKYLGDGKYEVELQEAARDYGVDPKSELWKLPPEVVGRYAEEDALKSLQVFAKQRPLLEKFGNLEIFELESRLLPILLEMRFRGVRVDLDMAEKVRKSLLEEEAKLQLKVNKVSDMLINVWSADDLRKYVELHNRRDPKNRIVPPETERGSMSFTKDWIRLQGGEFFQAVHQLRSVNKMRRDFIEGMVLENQVNGRLHTQFHQLRRDSEGTRSGRFSSTNPNLQQVPSRDKVMGPLIRSLFIPEDGCQWAKLDYSQQEPRVLLHYAVATKLQGADSVLGLYLKDPRTDWYKILQDKAGLSRKDSKDATLGRFYGMGVKRFASRYQKSEEEAEQVLRAFDKLFPFVRELSESCMRKASRTGFIRTLLGRHRHFNEWACERGVLADGRDVDTRKIYKTQDEAWKDQPGANLVRAGVHKALNSLIQGSCGDMIKRAMLNLWEEHKEVVHLTVHDELDQSVTSPEHARRLQEIMETCVNLKVPIVADLHLGPSWGEAKKP